MSAIVTCSPTSQSALRQLGVQNDKQRMGAGDDLFRLNLAPNTVIKRRATARELTASGASGYWAMGRCGGALSSRAARLAWPRAGGWSSIHIAPAIDACICVAGLGLGVLSYQIAGHLAAGPAAPVLTEFEPAPRPVQKLVYPHARLLPARVQVALDWLEARLRQRLARA